MSSNNQRMASTNSRGFREEAAEYLRAMPDKAVFAVLALTWIAVFHWLGNSTLGYVKSHSLFRWLGFCYDNSVDDEHGWLIPPSVLILYWWKRRELMAVSKSPWWPALFLLGLGSCLHIAGFLIQQARFSVVGFFVGLYAITGLVWGWRWLLATFFPFCLFTFSLPLASVQDNLTMPLRLLATKITVLLAQVLGINVVQQGNLMFDAQRIYQYEVAAACSGLRSLTAITAMSLIVAFLLCRAPWRRAAVIAAAVPLAVLANVFRLTMIIVAAETFGQKSGDWVHENAIMGMLPYIPAFAGLMFLAQRLRDDRPAGAAPAEVSGPIPSGAAEGKR